MCCWLGCLGILGPRITLVVMWLTGYLGTAYRTTLWPLLGFLFVPVTTIAYAIIMNTHGSVEGIYTVAMVLAVLFDLGILGGARRGREDES